MHHIFISDKNNDIRRHHIENETKKLGITPNFYDAIMARDLSKEELSTLTIPNTFLTPGEICCAKSHLEGGGKTIVRK
ncbi:glycosyltransferase family 25 protein [Histophilus somni]|nr:glycosyltransferase family 25 protein [Histophilus somni]